MSSSRSSARGRLSVDGGVIRPTSGWALGIGMNSDVSEGGVGITEARAGVSKRDELMSSITDAWLGPVRSIASGRLAGPVDLVVLASTVVGGRVGR